MSHIDTFDYKPGLIAAHGKPVNSSTKPDTFFGQDRPAAPAGLDVSPAGRERSLGLGPVSAPGPGRRRADGDQVDGRRHLEPHAGDISGEQRLSLERLSAAGAWLSYGLGSESDDLPAFVVIPDAREFPAGGAINWTNGFLPARHQGVVIRPQGEPIDDLFPASPDRLGSGGRHPRAGRRR